MPVSNASEADVIRRQDVASNQVSEPHLMTATLSTSWTTALPKRILVDLTAACGAAAVVAPIVTLIDRAIIEKASRRTPSISASLRTASLAALRSPARFATSTPFLLVYTLYASTYAAANTIDTGVAVARRGGPDHWGDVSAGFAKFVTTAAVNMGLCVYKDARFARFFGAGVEGEKARVGVGEGSHKATRGMQKGMPLPNIGTASPAATAVAAQNSRTAHISASTTSSSSSSSSSRRIPPTSYALFYLRDSLTVLASFNLPPLLAPHIPDAVAATPQAKTQLAQFVIPASVQAVSTPIHLLGLDLFNRPVIAGGSSRKKGASTSSDAGVVESLPGAESRFSRIRRDWAPSFMARVGRIVPAFGFGGVVNLRARDAGMVWLRGF